jgi:prolyl 4-hydroxylase
MQVPPQIAEVLALAGSGRAPEAVERLGRLADGGDGPACFQLAEWYREGTFVEANLAAARSLYKRAGQKGLVEGKRRYIALLAAGVGGKRDWKKSLALLRDLGRSDPAARRQLALINAMKLNVSGDPTQPPQGRTLSEKPHLVYFQRAFTAEECDYLIEAAGPLFETATTVDERTGKLILNPVRTSDTAVFPWVAENPAVHALNRRVAAMSRTDPMQGEPLQVLRYGTGQEYKPHIDAIPGLENQRIYTMLVYLNEEYEGGETQFLQAGAAIRGGKGDALLFHNVDEAGRPNPDVVHAGLPVRRGVKLLASRWIRERPVTA